jgi:hypothetical protein
MEINREYLQQKDFKLSMSNPHYIDLPPLEKCVCGHQPIIDVSMALIYCSNCGLCFEYRYNRGILPYYMWQEIHTKEN